MPFWLNIALGVYIVVVGFICVVGLNGIYNHNKNGLRVAMNGRKTVHTRGWILIFTWFIVTILWLCWNIFG